MACQHFLRTIYKIYLFMSNTYYYFHIFFSYIYAIPLPTIIPNNRTHYFTKIQWTWQIINYILYSNYNCAVARKAHTAQWQNHTHMRDWPTKRKCIFGDDKDIFKEKEITRLKIAICHYIHSQTSSMREQNILFNI